jgi:glyoxylase-like metal-dependent hydrolase (beta-lactamase superfamily II)
MMTAPEVFLEVRSRTVGAKQMNAYALVCPHTSESILIDPGDEPDTLREMLGQSTPSCILLTHTHTDHIGALEEMLEHLDVPLLAHPGPHTPGVTIKAHSWINNGDIIDVGRYRLRAIYTPGHSDDMISFELVKDSRIMVGDTLFDGGPGRTWNAEQFQTTLRTLREIVLQWPDETTCHPGHGPAFRLGDRRADIEAFVNKDHGDFYGDATWDM